MESNYVFKDLTTQYVGSSCIISESTNICSKIDQVNNLACIVTALIVLSFAVLMGFLIGKSSSLK